MNSYERLAATVVRVTEAVGSSGMLAGGAAVILADAPAAVAGRIGLDKEPA